MAAKKNNRGRKGGFVMGEEHRLKIKNSNIFRKLLQHAEGEIEMTKSQIDVSLALMRKVMPDLSSVTIEGGDDPVTIVTRIELAAPKDD